MSDRAESAAIALIREAHAPQPYDFPTEQTHCPSSDVPSDQCHTCVILAAVEAECQRLAESADRYDQAEQWEYAGGLREAAHHVREVVVPPGPSCDCDYWHSQHRWHCATRYPAASEIPASPGTLQGGDDA